VLVAMDTVRRVGFTNPASSHTVYPDLLILRSMIELVYLPRLILQKGYVVVNCVEHMVHI
jgi:hypothetical protein